LFEVKVDESPVEASSHSDVQLDDGR